MHSIKIPLRSIIPLSFSTAKELKDNNGTVILVALSAAGIGSAVLDNVTLLIVAVIALAIFYGNKSRVNTSIIYKSDNLYFKHGLHTMSSTELAANDIQRIDEVKDVWSALLGITTLKIYSNGTKEAVITARYILKDDANLLQSQCQPKAVDDLVPDFSYCYSAKEVIKASLLTGLKNFYFVGATQFFIFLTVGLKYLPYDSAFKNTKSMDETLLTTSPGHILESIASMFFTPEAFLFLLTMLFFIVVIGSQAARLTYIAPKFWGMNITSKCDQIKISSGFIFSNTATVKKSDIVRVTIKRGVVGKLLGGVAIKIHTVSSSHTDHFQLYTPYMANQEATVFMSLLGYSFDPLDQQQSEKVQVSVFVIYLINQLRLSILPIAALVLFVPLDKFSAETLQTYLALSPVVLLGFIIYRYRCFYNASIYDNTKDFVLGGFSWEPLVQIFHKDRVQMSVNVTSALFPKDTESLVITTDSHPMYIPSK